MNPKPIFGYFALLLTALVLIAVNTNSVYGQGKLDQIRKTVRDKKPAKPKRDDSRKRKSKKRNRNNKGNLVFDILVSSLITPSVEEVHVVHHTPPNTSTSLDVARPGTVYQPAVAPAAHQPLPQNDQLDYFDWGIRLTAVGGTDFDDIALGNFGLLLQIPGGFGIDTSLTILDESLSAFHDQLYLGDFNFVRELFITDRFRFRYGVGINWLSDDFGGDTGINLTSGFDWKLSDRWISTGEVDLGAVGDASLTHAQISLGRTISAKTEFTVGYDHREIGGVTIGSAFAGLRLRF